MVSWFCHKYSWKSYEQKYKKHVRGSENLSEEMAFMSANTWENNKLQGFGLVYIIRHEGRVTYSCVVLPHEM